MLKLMEENEDDAIEYGEMTTREAGRRGGAKTAQRGKAFYQSIGSMGGIATRESQSPEFYKRIGKAGGDQVKKNQPPDFYQKIGEMGGAKVKELLEAGKKALGVAKKARKEKQP
jgi:general stress protein YciG